jgi:4-amino-4-deoxy-L-arabinose transferase-like glycosyltransferase
MLTTDSTSGSRWFWPLALFTITLFALGLRWYYVSTALVLNPIRGDAIQYFAYAWNLVHHGVFSLSTPGATVIAADNYRDPGYPLFLGAWMKVFENGDSWYAVVLLCQALLGALTVTLTMQLGRLWLSAGWAAGAGLLMVIWPHSIAINGYLLTETLFGFLCALGMLLCARACQRASVSMGVTAGLVFGAAALTNAILLPFGILLAAFLAWRKLATRKICVALAAGTLLLPGAWAIRNAQLPAQSSGNSSLNRALGNFAFGTEPDFHAAYRDAVFGDGSTKAEASATLHAINDEEALMTASPSKGIKIILQRFGEHPWRYARWYLLEKPRELWGWDIEVGQGDIYTYPTRRSPFQTHPTWIAVEVICQAINPLLLLLMLASLYFAWRAAPKPAAMVTSFQRTALTMVICLPAFATLIYCSLQAEPRYSIPFRPFEMLLAITTLAGISQWWREHQHSLQQRRVGPQP